MGIYEIDFAKDTIIVDGHICKETEYKGIYKVQDNYLIKDTDWASDMRNHNLTIVYLSDVGKDTNNIEYITRYDNGIIESFMSYLKSINKTYTYCSCMFHDRPPMTGGMFPW